jgi:nicotinamide phosphoribosyltransferase
MVSIVSDTWDFWEVVTSFMKELKDLILERDGAVILRPDSGDPVKIICGDVTAPKDTPEHKGAVECLWDIFGGGYTKAGYKTLNPHIGLIYGDSITLQRAHDILDGLALKGFASSNVVLGIGSYTYQYVTRDTFGFAMKATSGVVNGERRDIFKNPKTDDGVKKSAKGLLRVEQEGREYVLYDNQSVEEEREGKLLPFFTNGRIHQETDLVQIRQRLQKYIEE